VDARFTAFLLVVLGARSLWAALARRAAEPAETAEPDTLRTGHAFLQGLLNNLYGWALAQARRHLGPRFRRGADAVTGTVLIALGVRAAV
jgi:hypothetical protein